MKLVRFVNGDSVYFPKYTELTKPCIDEEIRAKFDGCNFKERAAIARYEAMRGKVLSSKAKVRYNFS